MALTVTFKELIPLGGGMKILFLSVSDSDGTGGTIDVGNWFSTIFYAHTNDITTAVQPKTTWTDESETLTVNTSGSAADIYKVIVFGK